MMSKTVGDLRVGVLEQIGVKHIFGLIGDSLNPLGDAVRRSKIEWVGVRHEEGAALAAAGQAKLTGKLGVCAGTTGPGSTHLVAGLYEASRDHAPVLALSGEMPRKMQGTEFIQTTAPDLLFRDVSLYTETISSPAQAPAVIHQAIAAAYAGPGVAHLTLPQDVVAAKAVGAASSVATLKPRGELTASEADVAEIARRIDKVAAKTDTKFWDKVTHERAKWDEMLTRQADLGRSKDRIHPQAVARGVSDLARPGATFVLDTGLNTLWSANWIRQTGSQRIVGSFNNAAVGTALAQANGVQALDRSRQVIALTGDGGFNMLMGEFMTAVHHKLPVKVVIYDNSALGLITLEAESVGIVPFGEAIEFPNPDFAALARACGGHGFMARKPNDLMAAISEALTIDGPAIVDAIVAADEMPNMPHIELEQVGHYAMAKIKEAVLTVTGG